MLNLFFWPFHWISRFEQNKFKFSRNWWCYDPPYRCLSLTADQRKLKCRTLWTFPTHLDLIAFMKLVLLTLPNYSKKYILNILTLATLRDSREFPASTAVSILALLGFPSSYRKVPNTLTCVKDTNFKTVLCNQTKTPQFKYIIFHIFIYILHLLRI